MATDYDAPRRRAEDDLETDSLEGLKAAESSKFNIFPMSTSAAKSSTSLSCRVEKTNSPAAAALSCNAVTGSATLRTMVRSSAWTALKHPRICDAASGPGFTLEQRCGVRTRLVGPRNLVLVERSDESLRIDGA